MSCANSTFGMVSTPSDPTELNDRINLLYPEIEARIDYKVINAKKKQQ